MLPQTPAQAAGELRVRQFFKPLLMIIPLAVAGNIIYILLASEPHVLKQLGNCNPYYLLLAAAMVFVPWLAHSGRMLTWGRSFRRDLRPSQAFTTAVATDVGSAAMPTAIGGGFVKLGFLIKYGFTPGEAALVTMLGTIEDAVFFALAIPSAILLNHAWRSPHVTNAFGNLTSHWPAAAAAVVTLLLLFFVVRRLAARKLAVLSGQADGIPGPGLRFRERIAKHEKDFHAAVMFVLKNGRGTFAVNVLIAGTGWCCRYGAISALVHGLGYRADPVLFFLLQWVVFSAMTMVPTPGAVGGAEVSFALVYSGLVPHSIIPTLTGAWRFITFYLPIITGAIFLAISGAGFAARRVIPHDLRIAEEVKH